MIGLPAWLIALSLVVPATPALAQWSPFCVPLSAVGQSRAQASLGADGVGGAWVASLEYSAGGGTALALQHVTSTGVRASGWPLEGFRLAGVEPAEIAGPVSDGATGVFVAWTVYNSTILDLYLQHLDAAGQVWPGWPAGGRVVCGAPYSQRRPSIVPDGAGGVLIGWEDHRRGDGDIYCLRIDADGADASGWPSDGRLVCAATGDQTQPRLLPGSDGGCLVIWLDGRAVDAGTGIFAARLTPEGMLSPGWTSGGVALPVSGAARGAPSAIPDGEGGAFLTWASVAATATEIRASHLRGDGTLDPAWPAAGAAIVVGQPHGRSDPVIARNGDGLLVAWRDDRDAPSSGTREGSDVYVARVGLDGALDARWPVGGAAVARFGTDPPAGLTGATRVRIASETDGPTFVAWQTDTSIEYRGSLCFTRIAPGGPPVDGFEWEAIAEYRYSGIGLELVDPGDAGPVAVWSRYTWLWSTSDGQLLAQRLGVGSPPPIAVMYPTASVDAGCIRASWIVIGGRSCVIQRATAEHGWESVGRRSWAIEGEVVFLDTEPPHSARVGYRLLPEMLGAVPKGEVWLDTPDLVKFFLRARGPRPAVGALELEVGLPDATPARLELFDVDGRRVEERAIHAPGVVRLAVAAPGIYFARLSQGEHRATYRAMLLR